MKQIFLVILIVCSICLYSQEYDEYRKKFIYHKQKIYEITTNEDSNLATLKISNQKSDTINTIKSIELSEIVYDADLISFGEYIDEERKFILINARYKFYILNLYNDKLIGPFNPKFIGIGADAQSGMLSNMKIILHGTYISGYCVDSGPFLINLTDLYTPVEVLPASHPYSSMNRIYILSHPDRENKSFALFLQVEGWEVISKIVFTDKVVKYEDYSELLSVDENEIEEMLNNYDHKEGRYTVMEEIRSATTEYLVFDNSTGKLVYLPEKIRNSDKTTIIKYLQELQ